MKFLYDNGFSNVWQTLDYDLLNQKTCDAKGEEYEEVIDHLLYRGVLNPVDAEIIKSDNPQSDHYAISARFL
jgi:endonuclease/exonuclease/phosphatase (EEP) superfamily protein YafD